MRLEPQQNRYEGDSLSPLSTMQEETNSPGVRRRDVLQYVASGFAAALCACCSSEVTKAAEAKKQPMTMEDAEAREARLTLAAKEFMREKFNKNRKAAEIYQSMLPTVREFEKWCGVEPMLFKCMDGRTHTDDHKGLPRTTAKKRRSHGGTADLSVGNLELKNAINAERIDAQERGLSLLIIHTAHKSKLSTGCAAFKAQEDALRPSHTDDVALNYMHGQALRTQFLLRNDPSLNNGKNAVLSGITNTDTDSMQLFYDGREIFDAEKVMHEQEIMDPSDIFDDEFMKKQIAEDWAHESIRGKTLESLFDGHKAPFFEDMRVKIAVEAYLMRLIAESSAKHAGKGILNPGMLKMTREGIGECNEQVQTFLTYMMAINVAYSTHFHNLNHHLKKTDPEALNARVSHGEMNVAYSFTGHDLEPKNSFLLIKPGSGDEKRAMTIGRDVIKGNLAHMNLTDTLPPIVHINIEITKSIDSWDEMKGILARMRSKAELTQEVYGDDVRICTTYSYNEGVPTGEKGVARSKQYFPINAIPGNKLIIADEDCDMQMIHEADFDAQVLRQREREYTSLGKIAKMQLSS